VARTDAPAASRLSWAQRRFLLVLALPAFGLSLAYTLVTTYGPVLLQDVSGPTGTGLLIGSEGLLALTLPLLIGAWSDRLETRLGGRLPFVLAGGVLAVVALMLLPLGPRSLLWFGVCLTAFFTAYLLYYVPYYALYPDLVPREMLGRSQGFQGALRSLALLFAMAFGGVLISVWTPLPFLLGAGVLAVVTAGLYALVSRRLPLISGRDGLQGMRRSLGILRTDSALRSWLAASACWEAAIGSLRTFVVLYLTVGLGLSLTTTSAALALVGLGALLAAPVAGALADRYGPRPVIRLAVWVFAIGLVPTQISTSTTYVVAIVPVAFAAVVLMTLPYTLLVELLPRHQHGLGAGIFQLSRGVGILLGPVLAGVMTDLSSSVSVLTYAETEGYSAIFGVSAVLLLASLPFLPELREG
jgi:MFS family permease